MKSMPFFSVIVPAYNRALLLPFLFESLLQQNYSEWECIVVDDGSTDNTAEIVKSFSSSDSRFRYVYQQNAERSAARNRGARMANGTYLLFLDSDDFYLQEFLLSVHDWLRLKQYPVGMLVTGFHILREGSDSEPQIVNDAMHTNDVLTFLYRVPVIPARMVIHSKVFKSHSFDERIVVVEDQILCFSIASDFPIWHAPQLNGVVYRIHEQNSVNPEKNPFLPRLAGLQLFFSDSKYKRAVDLIPSRERGKLLAHCMYKIGMHHLGLRQKSKAFLWFLKGQVTCPGYKWKEMIYSLLHSNASHES